MVVQRVEKIVGLWYYMAVYAKTRARKDNKCETEC